MIETATSLTVVRELAEHPDSADLTRLLLNATSPAEAALALQILQDSAPQKTLVTACNLREVLGALPATPCSIAVDAQQVERIGRFERRPLGVLARELADGWELDVLCAGNLVLDIVLRRDGASTYLCPVPRDSDFVTPAALDAILESETLLDAILETIEAMGLVMNPPFYLSLEDFRLEHAQGAVESLGELF